MWWQVARRRESKASKLMRLSGSAAQAKAKGGRHIESWWAALPEYVPPVAWPTLLPVGTVRSSYDERRWRVSYGDGAQQARGAAATLCCHPVLQPCAAQAVTLCNLGCNPMRSGCDPMRAGCHPMPRTPCAAGVGATGRWLRGARA